MSRKKKPKQKWYQILFRTEVVTYKDVINREKAAKAGVAKIKKELGIR